MKTKWKVIIGVSVMAVLGIGAYVSTIYSKKGLVTVQTGSVVRQDLTSLVTASGEIKPKNYINIGANAQGQITELLVKEGDRVRKGQLLARIENVRREMPANLLRKQLEQFAGKLLLLVDRNAEAETKLGVIFKQGVGPGRTTSMSILRVRR